jgi:hypothetical protein
MWNCDNVTVDHNTFYGGGTMALQLHGDLDASWRITNNIFVDVIASNKSNAAINISRPSKNVVCDYNLYWRVNSPKMGMLGFRQTREGEPIPHGTQDAKTIEDMRGMFGYESYGVLGDPLFVDTEKGDYRLQKGSPAIGMGKKDEIAGMRNPPDGL